MKFPESWLREHIPTDAPRERLLAALTAIGLEVEEATELGGGLDGVVVAELVECRPHPEADRLQVCTVDAGGQTLTIVCGAPNARPGLKAPLATIGAVLPGDVRIKAAKLRGVESAGMLCSARELGLDQDAAGLMELPPDAPAGTPLADYLRLPDCAIELKLTPNRADCFSLRGIAHDVAAALGGAVRPVPVDPVPATLADAPEVRLEAGADCPRYVGRILRGIDPAARTPLWMAERLRRSGIRPISLLVDVTQYVMLELGQPMHAFDADAVEGAVVVRHARAGEMVKLLDERTVAPEARDLLIADARGPLALAGVMGGWDSRVTGASRNVLLEAAHFAPSAIIGRARRFGLHTDASHRFERGVDPALPRLAIERATRLILDLAGGEAGPVVEAERGEDLPRPVPVTLRRARLARVLGLDVADAEVERILRALGMRVEATDAGWAVMPPSSRFDIAIEEDLIEEIARIHGYDAIPTRMPAGEIRLAVPSETRVDEGELRRRMVARGYLEAIDYAFLDAATLATWGLDTGAVALANPLTSELGVMRSALLPGLVASLRGNRARQQQRVRLFEIGRVFQAAQAAGAAPQETPRIAAVACGPASAEQWSGEDREVDFYDLRGDLESLLAIGGAGAVTFRPTDAPWLHPGRAAEVWRGAERLGWIGHLHPRLVRALDLEGELVGFEIDLAPLSVRALPSAGSVSRFPSVRRDIAVVVEDAVPWAALEATLRAAAGPVLREALVFDRYVGKGVEPGFKSLAIGLILQDVSRTLTDREVEALVAAAVAALAESHGARIRG
ncbi:phenylalanine--tRNA ligase subunit beta [Coralloluteibacterium thermophilus]|uniref:Phenylalanine--tRNA ligase beta subunit n=1 Tax=Coralloluteibacterium thermophilum TaxID=2707049 RepID=A0ABV9NLI0_9GAMM